MKKKLVFTAFFMLAMAFIAAPVPADTVVGFGTITATGDRGTILTIDGLSTGSYLLGQSTVYDSSGTGQGTGGLEFLEPGADDFSFDKTTHSLDNYEGGYIQTIFGTTNSWDTFYIFESGGNDNADYFGVRADGTLTAGFSVASAGSIAEDTGYNTGFNNRDLMGYLFTTSEKVAGIRITDVGVDVNYDAMSISTAAVPIPGAAWLLGSGLIGLVAIRRRIRK